jgi:hypothetical protein
MWSGRDLGSWEMWVRGLGRRNRMLVMGLWARALDLFGVVRAEVSDLAERVGRLLRCAGRSAISKTRAMVHAWILDRR